MANTTALRPLDSLIGITTRRTDRASRTTPHPPAGPIPIRHVCVRGYRTANDRERLPRWPASRVTASEYATASGGTVPSGSSFVSDAARGARSFQLEVAVQMARQGGKMATVENRYLVGNYAPVADEVTATELPVTGSLPEALCGRYLRNGPNPLAPPEPSTYHWFTGDGMVHGVRIRDGRAEWYRNRWVRSAEVAQALGEQIRPGPV